MWSVVMDWVVRMFTASPLEAANAGERHLAFHPPPCDAQVAEALDAAIVAVLSITAEAVQSTCGSAAGLGRPGRYPAQAVLTLSSRATICALLLIARSEAFPRTVALRSQLRAALDRQRSARSS